MIQSRHLQSDIWNSFRFFITVNGFIIAAVIATFRLDRTIPLVIIFFITLFTGIIIILIALKILDQQIDNYLEMYIRRVFLEENMGFYNVSHFPHVNSKSESF